MDFLKMDQSGVKLRGTQYVLNIITGIGDKWHLNRFNGQNVQVLFESVTLHKRVM